MGRAPCCDKAIVKKGPWSPDEDARLKEYIEKNGTGGNWIALPRKAGLRRCGKSCRLRWLNYLRPEIKHGEFSEDEDRIICDLFATIGSRWSVIAARLPGRTDNDVKNYWNTKLKKKITGFLPNHAATSQSSKLSVHALPSDPPIHHFSSAPSSSLRRTSSSSSSLTNQENHSIQFASSSSPIYELPPIGAYLFSEYSSDSIRGDFALPHYQQNFGIDTIEIGSEIVGCHSTRFTNFAEQEETDHTRLGVPSNMLRGYRSTTAPCYSWNVDGATPFMESSMEDFKQLINPAGTEFGFAGNRH